MMKDSEKLSTISARITTGQLCRLYDRLDDEATPYALRVGKGENHQRAVTIFCEEKKVGYFTNILNYEIQLEI